MIVLIVVALGTSIFWWYSNDTPRALLGTSGHNANVSVQATAASIVLNDMGVPVLSADERGRLEATIEDWQLYQPNPNIFLGGLDCGMSERHDQLVVLDHSEKRSYSLNDGLLITTTPNLYNWTQAALDAFAADPTVVCGAATPVPHVVVGDRVLWWNTCVGGAGPPSVASSDYQRTVRCLQAEDAVDRHFGLTE